jgi:protein required for attachment to host cells
MQAEKAFWVVVADEARAIVYARATKRGALTELLTLENPDGRKKAGELVSDRGGRSFDSSGQGRHAMGQQRTGPKVQIATTFARQVAGEISKATHSGRCRGYVLVAAPRFLGLLRDALSTHSSVPPYQTIDKEVVGKDAAFLKKLVDG